MLAKFLVHTREQSDDEEGTLFYVTGYMLNKRRESDDRWTRSPLLMLFVPEETWNHLVTGQEFDLAFSALLPPKADAEPGTPSDERPN